MAENSEIEYHLPYPLFDSHFHASHMGKRDMDPGIVVAKAFDLGLVGAIDVATDEKHFDKRVDFLSVNSALRLSAGIHPSSVTEDFADRLNLVAKQAEHPAVVAIGETGLDSYHNYSPADLQEKSFRHHLDLAHGMDLPVIVHNREADERVLRIISESDCRRGIFHCFSSDLKTAKMALGLGFFVSFAGNLTFKSNEKLRNVAREIPPDRLLVETDAPFLSPVPRRGRPNHPGHIGYTLELLAEIRGENPTDLAEIVLNNTTEIFSIKT